MNHAAKLARPSGARELEPSPTGRRRARKPCAFEGRSKARGRLGRRCRSDRYRCVAGDGRRSTTVAADDGNAARKRFSDDPTCVVVKTGEEEHLDTL